MPICLRPGRSLKILESRGWYFMSIMCDTDRDRQQQQPVSEHNSTTAVTTADSSHGNSGVCALPLGELLKQIQKSSPINLFYLGKFVL